jgi:hypothetical protein
LDERVNVLNPPNRRTDLFRLIAAQRAFHLGPTYERCASPPRRALSWCLDR